MLYKVDPQITKLEPVPFLSISGTKRLERDLENLIANNLFGLLFESPSLMPIFQERSMQPEADIYAVDPRGDIHIFELKRDKAGRDAVQQLLRYAEEVGSWTYKDLNDRFVKYRSTRSTDLGSPHLLVDAHRDAFGLTVPIETEHFNRSQSLWVIANAADEELIGSVEFWRTTGLKIDFIPYRLYKFEAETYFEFFSKPHDRHSNPDDRKGVLFNTNRSYEKKEFDTLKWMIEKRRVSAFGSSKEFVRRLGIRDTVFYYHNGLGVVAAAEVISVPKQDGEEELHCDVKFLTTPPSQFDRDIPAIPPSRLEQIKKQKFFWASTVIMPYLSRAEAVELVKELRGVTKQR